MPRRAENNANDSLMAMTQHRPITTRGNILSGVIIAAALFVVTPARAAPDDLIVEFQATPLFSEANFLPGNDIVRWAKVTNNTADTRPIAVEAINTSDPDGLGDVLDIGIYENGVQRYATTTLAAFFGAGEVVLSNVAGNGGNTRYDFVVSFKSSAGDPYQGKSVGFDILVGFQGEGGGDGGNGNGAGPQGDGGGNGGGGVSGGGPQGLSIFNEETAAAVAGETTALIQWATSYRSTSRVVYGTAPGLFDYTILPNYGYPFSTPEFDTPANAAGVLNHAVTITGLTPGTIYYYRTISHASPDTISREQHFTTNIPSSGKGIVLAGEAGPRGETRVETGEKTPGAGGIPPREEAAGGPPVGSVETETSPATRESATAAGTGGSALAAIGAAFTLGTGKAWIGVLVALIAAGLITVIVAAIIRRRKKENSP